MQFVTSLQRRIGVTVHRIYLPMQYWLLLELDNERYKRRLW